MSLYYVVLSHTSRVFIPPNQVNIIEFCKGKDVTHNYLSTDILIKEKSGRKSYIKTNISPSLKKNGKKSGIKQIFITKNIMFVKNLDVRLIFCQ